MKRFLVWFLTLSLILTGLATGASAAAGDGWKQAGEEWQYFENGEAVREKWIQSNGKWYYFDGDGYMVHDQFLYLTEETETDENGESYTYNVPSYYMQSDGSMLAGGWSRCFNGKAWAYAYEDGTLPHKWAKIDGDWYYFSHGYMYENTVIRPQEGVSTYYAIGKDGKMVTDGWFGREYKYGHYDENDQWIEDGTRTSWYYANKDGVLLKGWQKIDGEWYFFYQKGFSEYADFENAPYMFSNVEPEINGKYYIFEKSGTLAKSGWVDTNAKFEWGEDQPFWVYVGEDGAEKTGWFQLDGKWYYANEWAWVATNTLIDVNGVTYAFGKDCALVDGWFKNPWSSSDIWYYSTENGILVSTWKQIDGVWYYFNEDGAMMHDVKDYVIDGKPYTFDKSGAWVK